MKVLVAFKLSRNPQDARIMGSNVDWKGVRLSPGDDDHAAMAVARQLAGGDEIVAVTVGDGDLAWAAARGASRTIAVTDVPADAESALVGDVIAAVCKKLGAIDVVVAGDNAWDYALSAALAGCLDIPAIAGVVSAEAGQGGIVRLARKMGPNTQTLEAAAPLLLSVAADKAEQQPPGMKDVLAARKKPMERLAMKDLGVSPVPGCRSRGTRLPDTPPAKIIDGSNPAEACGQLLNALRSDGAI